MFDSIFKLSTLWFIASLFRLSAQLFPTVRTQQLTNSSNTTWSCEQLDFCSDLLGFEAIQWLHRQLDDDANGNVDVSESDEFLRDELKYENGYERQKAFHGNDKQITVDELWKSWKESAVRNWTVEETIQWLCDSVELPQYVEQFQTNAVDGLALPRLAANTQFISILGINNPIHKQKLALKAMDVVLFGAPKHHNYIKDALLVLSIVIAMGGCWFAYVQNKYSKAHLKKMLKDMDSLQKAEEQLMGLQRELDRTRKEQQNVVKEKVNLEKKLKENESQIERSASYTGLTDLSRISELEDELNRTREELKRAQNTSSGRWSAPQSLQYWLQLTHELEIRSYNTKKSAAELQLYAAKEGCDKLRRKRSTLLGAFRVAHGNSIDDVDNRILGAKAALSEVTKDLQERLQRWRQIEMYCGFAIIHNPGMAYLESVLYGSPVNGSGSLPVMGLSRAGSENTIMDDDSLHLSGSVANVSIAGFGLHSSYDKTSLLSINLNDSHRKHSNGTVRSTNSALQSSDDEFEEDVIGMNSSYVIDNNNSSNKDVLKPLNSIETKRSKMVKSYSEDQGMTPEYEKPSEREMCHSESCNDLQSCGSIGSNTTTKQSSSSTAGDSPNANTIRNEKLVSNVLQNQRLKSVDVDSETASNDSNSVKDFDQKISSTEKKRSFFALRKRKNSKHL